MYERIFTGIALELSDADTDRRLTPRSKEMTTATLTPTPAMWMPAFKAAIANGARPRPAETTGRPEDGKFVCCACGLDKPAATDLAGWVTSEPFDDDPTPMQGCVCLGCCPVVG